MKKLLLFLTCATGLLYPASYSQLRSEFKEKLSLNMFGSFGLLEHDDYMTFAEKYILKSEQNLAIAYKMTVTNNLIDDQVYLFQKYLRDILRIHKCTFTHLVFHDKSMQWDLQFYSSSLLKSIHHLKREFNLDVDPEIEFKNTINLIQKVNQDFIKQIGPCGCAKIRWDKHWRDFKRNAREAAMIPVHVITFPVFYYLYFCR